MCDTLVTHPGRDHPRREGSPFACDTIAKGMVALVQEAPVHPFKKAHQWLHPTGPVKKSALMRAIELQCQV